MNDRRPGWTSAPSCGIPDLQWCAPGGAPVPEALAGFGDIALARDLPLPVASAVLCPVAPGALPSMIETLRASVGQEAYLIAVFDEGTNRATLADAISLGADDAFVLGDNADFAVVLARARRCVEDRRSSRAVHRSQEIERDYLQACIDNLPAPIFFKNAQGVYVGCNRAFEQFLGFPAEDIVGRTVWQIAPSELADKYEHADRELMAQGGVQVYDCNVRFADGSLREVSFHKAVIVDGNGAVRGIAGAMLDITDRKKLESELKHAAEHDPLTNLFNRRKFFEAASEMAVAAAAARKPLTVAILDIDHFKSVNDGHGHAIGDQVLCEVAAMLERDLSEIGLVARTGGEEFYIVLPDLSVENATSLLERLRRNVAARVIRTDNGPLNVTISIGLAGLDPSRESLSEALKRADWALYRAKHGGRNRTEMAA